MTTQPATPRPVPRDAIIAAARAWLATPYHHQQSVRHVGTDCLGLVRGVWRDVYGYEPELPPPYAPDWADATGDETLHAAACRHLIEIAPAAAVPGDVLLFRYQRAFPAKHVGILIAPGRLLHACEGMAVSDIELSSWWRRRIAAAFAFPPLST